MSIRPKLIFLCLFSALVPIGILCALVSSRVVDYLSTSESKRLATVLKFAADEISFDLRSHSDELSLIAKNDRLLSLAGEYIRNANSKTADEISNLLAGLLPEGSTEEIVSYAAMNGEVVASSSGVKLEFPSVEIAKLFLDRNSDIESKVLKQGRLLIVRILRNADEAIGVLYFTCNLKHFASNNEGLFSFWKSGRFYLIEPNDAKNAISLGNDKQFINSTLSLKPVAQETLDAALARVNGSGAVEILGLDSPLLDTSETPLVAAAIGLKSLGMVLTLTVSHKEVFQFKSDVFIYYVRLIAGMLLAVGLTAYFVAQGLTRPLHRLMDAVRQIKQFGVHGRVPEGGFSETKELGRRFNRLLEILENTTVSRDLLIDEVAKRESAQNLLSFSESLFKGVVDSAVEAIVMIDKYGTVKLFNPVAQRLFGYASAEVLGQNVKMLVPAHIAQHHDFFLERYRNTKISKIVGKGLRRDFGRRKEGILFPIEFQIHALLLEGQEHFVAFMSDISEKIKLQDKLEEAQKLESLWRLSSGIAHEINSPLLEITFAAERVQRLCREGKIEEAVQAAERIIQSAEGVSRIIKSLKHLSHQAEESEMSAELVLDIVNDVYEVSRTKFEFKEVALEILNNLGAETESITCVRSEINQILMNLLNNAFDAVVALPEKWVQIELKKIGTQVEISVTDSGGGIPKETQERIFEPLFTSKEIGKGLGLGLSISASLAKRNKGELSYDRDCKNTKFCLRLNAA